MSEMMKKYQLELGSLHSTVGLFSEEEIDVIMQAIYVAQSYRQKAFSLSRSGAASKKYGHALAIVRRFSADYPFFLTYEKSYFTLSRHSFATPAGEPSRQGFTVGSGIFSNGVNELRTTNIKAAARFFQIVLQTLKKPGGLILTMHGTEKYAGPMACSDTSYSYSVVAAVTREQIDYQDSRDFSRAALAKMEKHFNTLSSESSQEELCV